MKWSHQAIAVFILKKKSSPDREGFIYFNDFRQLVNSFLIFGNYTNE